MIYSPVSLSDPICQGDIFIGLPRIEISLKSMIIVDEVGKRVVNWVDIAQNEESKNIIVPVRPVIAIVVTQNCDAIRSRDITLCEIRQFKEVELKCKDTQKAKAWKDIITQQSKINLKWFYLPPDESIGLSNKMAVDFIVTIRLPRIELEEMKHLRKGKLNEIANAHFRERISEFFRRYPYDEWYPLNKEELEVYTSDYPEIKPYPWQ